MVWRGVTENRGDGRTSRDPLIFHDERLGSGLKEEQTMKRALRSEEQIVVL